MASVALSGVRNLLRSSTVLHVPYGLVTSPLRCYYGPGPMWHDAITICTVRHGQMTMLLRMNSDVIVLNTVHYVHITVITAAGPDGGK